MTQKLFFICSQIMLRSPTAEIVFSSWDGLECDSAGIAHDADTPSSPEQINWADVIFVMEKRHRAKLSRKFKKHLNGKRVIVLGIPDDSDYIDPDLVALLEKKVPRFLR